MDELRWRALQALEYELAQSIRAPRRRTKALGFVLAFLGNFADDRAVFDRFWKALADDGPARWHHADAALIAIYDAVGTKRGDGPKRRPGMPVFLTREDRKALRFLSGVLSGTERKHQEAAERAAQRDSIK